MPSKSLKQHQLMLAVSKDEDLAEKLNIDQSVAREFVSKDKEAGLFEEASMESFDSTALEQDELNELLPSTEDIEANREVSVEDDHEDAERREEDEDEYSEESHKDPEKPFRFDDRFKE